VGLKVGVLLLVVPSRFVSAKLSEENYERLDRMRDAFEDMLGIKMSLNDALSLILYYIENEMESGEFKSKLIRLLISAKSQSVGRPTSYYGGFTR
jgi:hypothetical protein